MTTKFTEEKFYVLLILVALTAFVVILGQIWSIWLAIPAVLVVFSLSYMAGQLMSRIMHDGK